MSTRTLVVALLVQVALGVALVLLAVGGFPTFGIGDAAQQAATPRADRFDGARAWADARAIVRFGPRPAGSHASRRLAAWLRARIPHGRYEVVPGGLRNVVGELPGRRPAILLAAHYDTKDIPGFAGANDGAAGDAVVLEVARALAHGPRRRGAPAVALAFFDGEESPRGTPDRLFAARGLRGSKAYARRHAGSLRAAIVVDFVGQRGLVLRRELNSDARLWARLRAAARRAGVARTFPPGTTLGVLDDHSPFAARGVPAIDLIDFAYRCWHRRCDTLAQLSRRSLDATGEALVELLR